jgi:hypothetical protein
LTREYSNIIIFISSRHITLYKRFVGCPAGISIERAAAGCVRGLTYTFSRAEEGVKTIHNDILLGSELFFLYIKLSLGIIRKNHCRRLIQPLCFSF